MEQDYYRLLGVAREAPEREIKRAYYELARQLHPDKAATPEEAKANGDKLALISRAYNTLKDPAKRAEYDTQLKAGTAEKINAAGAMPSTAPKAVGSAPASAPAAGSAAPPAGAAGSQPAPKLPGGPAAPAVPTGSPKMSQNDLQQQRVALAQKAFVKGMGHYKVNEFEKALPFFEAAIQNDPEGEPQYHVKYATTLLRTKGSFNKAIESISKAIEMDPYKPEFRYLRAEIYETAGVKSGARKEYEEILKWDPDDNRAKAKLSMMDTEEAKQAGLLAKLLPSVFGKKK